MVSPAVCLAPVAARLASAAADGVAAGVLGAVGPADAVDTGVAVVVGVTTGAAATVRVALAEMSVAVARAGPPALAKTAR
jgi:hypothetical protein